MTPALLLLPLALVLAPAGLASARADTLPAEVIAERQSIMQTCQSSGRQATFGADYARTADLNGDGRPDYILDRGNAGCTGNPAAFCGTGGCRISVFVSTPDGYRDANLGMMAFGATVRPGEPLPTLVISGRNGEMAFRWDGTALGRVDNAPPAVRTAATQPAGDPPYGRWVFLARGRCAGEAVVIEPGRIVIDFAGDETTYQPVRFERCEGAVCTFALAEDGARWSTRRLAANRIIFREPMGPTGESRLEARRAGPGCQ